MFCCNESRPLAMQFIKHRRQFDSHGNCWCPRGTGYLQPPVSHYMQIQPHIAKFVGPTWVPPGSCRSQMGPMNLAIRDRLPNWYLGLHTYIKMRSDKINHNEPVVVFKSSPSSAAYMRQWIGSALVQIMACRLFDIKPLSKPMLGYCLLEP